MWTNQCGRIVGLKAVIPTAGALRTRSIMRTFVSRLPDLGQAVILQLVNR